MEAILGQATAPLASEPDAPIARAMTCDTDARPTARWTNLAVAGFEVGRRSCRLPPAYDGKRP